MDPEDSFNNNGSQVISRMDALLFAVALEVVLLQMRVHEGSTELMLSCKPKDQSGKLQYEKLVRDRDLVKDVLRTTMLQLAETGEWNCLQEAVKLLEKCILTTVATRKEYERLKTTSTNILRHLEGKRKHWENDIWDAENRIALLRDKKQELRNSGNLFLGFCKYYGLALQSLTYFEHNCPVKDDLLNAKTRLRYAEMWLTARAESQQLEFQIQRKRAPIRSSEHENRIHEEIFKAIEIQIEERERDIEYWQVRYAEDKKDICQRLEKQQQELQVATTRREELQEMYKLHEGEMRSWLSFKEQRSARLAREEKIRKSATLIEAWWRGVMVRKALGAFRYLKNLKKSPARGKRK